MIQGRRLRSALAITSHAFGVKSVSALSGSDRVPIANKVELIISFTGSLPLLVLTSSLIFGHYHYDGSDAV